MKMALYIMLVATLTLPLLACSQTDSQKPATANIEQSQADATMPEPIAELQVSNERNAELKDTVIPIQTQKIEEKGYTTTIIGASFDKSTGDTIDDTLFVGTGLEMESSDHAMARGMAIGFKNSSDSKIANKNAYLSIYLFFQFDENISQRDSIIPELTVTGTDNKKGSVDFIYFSCEDKFIDVEYPYATLILKTYDDSDSIELRINNKIFHVDVVSLLQSETKVSETSYLAIDNFKFFDGGCKNSL